VTAAPRFTSEELVAEAFGWRAWDAAEAERVEAQARAATADSDNPAHLVYRLADELTEIGIPVRKVMTGLSPARRRLIVHARVEEDESVVGSPKRAAAWLNTARAGRAGMPTLICGQTGTGKNALARVHHRASGRRGEFLAENCAAITATIAESELFGCVQNAGTSVAERAGLFRRANGGTLFLDEIGELSLDIQAKLLRAIESGEMRRAGGMSTDKVDVAIVAATNRNLKEDVAAGRFREDLFYRLSVVMIDLPPLSEWPEEIIAIAQSILSRASMKSGVERAFTPLALRAIAEHDWPGNVRQLKHAIERACCLWPMGPISADQLGMEQSLRPDPVPRPTRASGFSAEQLSFVRDRRSEGKTEKEILPELNHVFGLEISHATYCRRLKSAGVSRLRGR